MLLSTPLLCLIGLTIASDQVPIFSPFSSAGNNPNDAFQTFQSETSPNHSLRIKRQNSTLCDTPVAQWTGWLDIANRAHLFFWFFESEAHASLATESTSSASSSPLTLWLTGGPGGSSMLGMLQELGPCLINKHGNGTVHNPYGWNKESALLFVDQPAGVGFSYPEPNVAVPGDSFTSARDMHIFLQIFISQAFPSLLKGPFHISGESYAGHYIPTLGAEIVAQNTLHPHAVQVPLKSVLIGDGFISPVDSIFGYWETLCTTNPGVDKPIFNETRCDIMATNMPRCIEVMNVCYNHQDPAICQAAESVCWSGVLVHYDGESYKGGRNRFDITAPCEMDVFCYKETQNIEDYLNLPHVFAALDVPAAITNYSIASEAVGYSFAATNDGGISMQPQIQYLLASEIDVLIYQGNLDLCCNTAGNLKWANAMPWKGQTAFASEGLREWKASVGGKDVGVGKFKEVRVQMAEGGKKTRFAFVTVDRAGHMVPMDQPEVALAMLTKWLGEEDYA